MEENSSQSFEDVKGRLDEIVEAVSSEDISLDDALKLYEEAVELGLVASSLLEENLEANNAAYDEEQASDRSGDQDAEESAEQDAQTAAEPAEGAQRESAPEVD